MKNTLYVHKFMPVHHIPGPDLLTYFKDELVDVLVRHWQQMEWTSCQCEVHSPWTQICNGQKACSKTKAFLWHISRICDSAFFAFSLFFYFVLHGSRWIRKNGKKRGHCPLWATPPPKRVKRGHLLSDYRQKCVNATRDMLMSKARKMTILTITMFNENVHTGSFFNWEVSEFTYRLTFRGVPVKKDTL